jgi:hypothetical protein
MRKGTAVSVLIATAGPGNRRCGRALADAQPIRQNRNGRHPDMTPDMTMPLHVLEAVAARVSQALQVRSINFK